MKYRLFLISIPVLMIISSFDVCDGSVTSASPATGLSISDDDYLRDIAMASAPSEFYELVGQFQADRSALGRKYTIGESQEYYDRIKLLFADWMGYLEGIDYDGLSSKGKIDYQLFKNVLNRDLYFLKQDESEFHQVQFVTDWAGDLYQFIRDRRRGKTVDGQTIADIFFQASEQLKTASGDLSAGEPFESRRESGKAASVIRSLRENLTEAYEFYYGYNPEFTWWVEKPYEELNRLLGEYEQAANEHYSTVVPIDDGSGITGRQAGREELIRRLEFEMIPYSIEELIEIGRSQFAWCRKEMLKASNELGFGDDWKAALEYVKDQHVPAGKQPEMVNRLAEESIEFLESHDLITLPDLSKEVWRMVMMSPQRQLTAPFFLGGEAIHISYPTHTMDHDLKIMSMRGNNPHFSMATVHHELLAGHHLQGFMNQRINSYRRMFNTSFWGEGWCLYWEFLLYDMGFPESPEDRIGFLFWRSHRAARIIFTLNYQMGLWTPQQCIDFLVDEVGHERANAEAEVRGHVRGSNHLYQISYMIGGLQMWALRGELVDSGLMDEKEFHDRIIRENSMPIEMLRVLLKDLPLERDFKPAWRFPYEMP